MITPTIKKRILPSSRLKKRYVAFEVISNSMLDAQNIQKAIKHTLAGFKANKDSNVAFIEKKFNESKKRGIVRIAPRYVSPLISILQAIKNIQDHKVTIQSIGMSGSLKKAYQKYIV